VVATIPGGGSPSLAITPDGSSVYAPSWADGNVVVIRISDNSVVARIPVEKTPNGVAITPDGAYAYVTNYSSNSLSIIRTADNTVVTSLQIPAPGRITIGRVQP
jgi:YVTN family beta-propeller protein